MKKIAHCPNRGTFGLQHGYSYNAEHPCLGRVTPFDQPSTRTSDAAITRERLTMCSMPLHYHEFLRP